MSHVSTQQALDGGHHSGITKGVQRKHTSVARFFFVITATARLLFFFSFSFHHHPNRAKQKGCIKLAHQSAKKFYQGHFFLCPRNRSL